MKLLSDLKDIQGRLIARAGRKMNRTLIQEVIAKGKSLQKKLTRLNLPFFLKDVERVMDEPVYRQMFQPPSHHTRVIQIIKKAKIQSSLFREIVRLRRTSFYTYRHFLLIGALSAKISMDLRGRGYDPQKAFVMGLTHDLGKTRLPRALLNKKTALSSNEYKILHSYPHASLLLLRYYLGKSGTEACRVAYDHHEKLDGSGYPRGIKRMSKYTQLVAIIDIFDALIADRPYRKRGFTVRGAVDKLLDEMHAGKLPEYPVLLMISYLRKDKPYYKNIKVSRHAREIEPEGNVYGKVSR